MKVNNRLLHLLILILVTTSCSLSRIINVADFSNHTLEYYLCKEEGQSQLTPGVTLNLNSNITHEISLGKFCALKNLTNVTITGNYGNGSTNRTAVVQCAVDSPRNYSIVTARGFAFIGCNGLTLKGIHFKHCGGPISPTIYYNDTSLPTYFGAYQSTTLFFSHTLNLTLSSITVSQYYGFAVAIINSFGFTNLSKIEIYDSLNDQLEVCTKQTHIRGNYSCYGTGLLIYSHDECTNSSNDLCSWLMEQQTIFNHSNANSIIITDSSFHDNQNYIFDYICILNVFQFQPPRVPIVSAPAVTIAMTQSSFNTSVSLLNVFVYQNYGLISGGMLALFINTPFHSWLQFNDLTFQNNTLNNTCVGTAFITYIYFTNDYLTRVPNHLTLPQLMNTWTALNISNTLWKRHIESNELRRSSTVYITLRSQPFYKVKVIFERVNFTNNSATYTGVCLDANTAYEPMIGDKRLVLVLKDVNAMNNTQANGIASVLTNSSLFVFYRLERVFIETSPSYVSHFDNNLGSVIDAFSTEIYLKGNLIFSKNNATNGPAILLRSSSFLVLGNNTHVVFKSNTAFLRGGAIYSVEEGTETSDCILQIDSNTRSVDDLNINLTFVNNLAYVAGNSIYIRPLQHCFQTTFHAFPSQLSNIYDRIFYFPLANGTSSNQTQISSIPVTICKCDPTGNKPLCKEQFDWKEIYPGDTISVTLVAQDENNLNVQSLINASFSQIDNLLPLKDWSLELRQEIRSLIGTKCQVFEYTVLSNLKGPRRGRLNFAVPGKPTYTYVPIELKDCPPGMTLNVYTKRCECKQFLNDIGLSCNTTSMSITKPQDAWVGVVTDTHANTSYVAYSQYCPDMYCSNTNNILVLDDSNSSTCLNNRDGVLCGACKEGYSALHGGKGCKVCDNNLGLLSLIGNLAVGITIVIVIFVLKLTLDTGTIGGLIFYANVFGIVNTVPLDYVYALPLEQLVQLINIQQGFPACLYKGMQFYIDMVIHFVYSVYLWFIVFAIILIAQCSTRVSKLIMKSSVQVLMTIIHLSFTKLLVTSIDVYVFGVIQTENSTHIVWFYNGSIHYGTGVHIPLLITATLCTLCVLLPYMVFAACGWMFFRFSCIIKLRPFLDTIYAPYKDKYRHWFGLRLILLTIIAILTASLHGPATFYQYLLQIILLTFFTIFQAYLKPFRKTWANVLDNWCMMNALCLLFINMYSIYGGKGSSVLLLIALIVFCITVLLVLFYHIWLFLKLLQEWLCINKCCRRKRNGTLLLTTDKPSPPIINHEGRKVTYSTIEKSDSPHHKVNYREPLLEYVDRENDY